MTFDHLPHNREVKDTWDLRLGHHVYRNDRVGEGRVGLLLNGTFTPLESNPSFVEGKAGECASKSSLDSPLKSDAASPSSLHNNDIDVDHAHLEDLLSSLACPKHAATIDALGLETAKGRDILRDSVVVVTHVNTFDSQTLHRMTHPDRIRFGCALFEEASESGRGGCHVSGVLDDNDDDDAEGRAGGEAKPVSPLPRPGLVGVGDAPPRAWRSALGQNATGGTSAPACTDMFVHYVRAMERPSVRQRGMDSLYWVADVWIYGRDIVEYWLKRTKMALGGRKEACCAPWKMTDDYFPLDELLKYMLAAVRADVAIASTMQLLEIFEDKDKAPVKAKDIRRSLRRIRPQIIVKRLRDSSGRERRVALLSPPARDTASLRTISEEETLYEMDLDSKSEKWDETCTVVDNASVMSIKLDKC